jgi:SAM-dependent methyltransferase
MGLKFSREKKKSRLFSLIYMLDKFFFLSTKRKFRLYLDLEWSFNRMLHEYSFKYYNAENHPFRIASREFLLNNILPEHTVLDLGCNNGSLTYYISRKAKSVTGIDHDKAALAQACRNYQAGNLQFIEADAGDYLKNNNGKYDVLILSHILEHIDEPEKMLRQFISFFKYVYIEFPDFDSSFANHYRKDLGNSLIYTDNDHIHEWDRHEVKKMLTECGLSVISAEYIYGMQKYWCSVN